MSNSNEDHEKEAVQCRLRNCGQAGAKLLVATGTQRKISIQGIREERTPCNAIHGHGQWTMDNGQWTCTWYVGLDGLSSDVSVCARPGSLVNTPSACLFYFLISVFRPVPEPQTRFRLYNTAEELSCSCNLFQRIEKNSKTRITTAVQS